jgi:hypothetical protein
MSGNSSGFLSDAAGHRQVDQHTACRFLRALGKEPATARLRAFPHKHSRRKREIGARRGGWDLNRAQQWQREGRGIYLVINDGGDSARSIRRCRALFIEWDDRPLVWQLQAWRQLGLPRPSLTVSTGGGSAHLYWVLEPAVAPELWAPIQARLIAHAGSDPHCRDASRVCDCPASPTSGATTVPSPGLNFSSAMTIAIRSSGLRPACRQRRRQLPGQLGQNLRDPGGVGQARAPARRPGSPAVAWLKFRQLWPAFPGGRQDTTPMRSIAMCSGD